MPAQVIGAGSGASARGATSGAGTEVTAARRSRRRRRSGRPARRCRSSPRPTFRGAPAIRATAFWSRTIFTGTRCTTLVKLPVALSGGSSANVLPVPGDQLSTWPGELEIREGVDRDPGRLADPDVGHLGLLEVRGDPEVGQRQDGDHLRADIDELAEPHLPLRRPARPPARGCACSADCRRRARPAPQPRGSAP